jgi:hypothetical protein
MCNQCNKLQLKPEIQQLLNNEMYNEYAQQNEYETNWWNTAKNYASSFAGSFLPPFINWNSGSSIPPPAPPPQTETGIIKAAIAAGERNENTLTDKLFFRRHPELGGKPLTTSMPNFTPLSQEWLSIRNNIVRPALLQPVTPPVTVPGNGVPSNGLLQRLLNTMNKKGYTIFTQPFKINIVGIRANNAQPNSFDDSINVFYKDSGGNWIFKSNPATTDPGLYYLNNPMNVSGTAIIIPGQYPNSHKIGLHRGEYTALVQQGPMKIIRDTNKDGVLDFRNTNVVNGTYGLNIHRATSSGTSTKVDRYSAGCQVFANSTDFANFIAQAQKHSGMYGNNFTYTLMDEGDLF